MNKSNEIFRKRSNRDVKVGAKKSILVLDDFDFFSRKGPAHYLDDFFFAHCLVSMLLMIGIHKSPVT